MAVVKSLCSLLTVRMGPSRGTAENFRFNILVEEDGGEHVSPFDHPASAGQKSSP